ncbi:hypothetical protein ACH5RR_037671 [Cinchona calisaya]|uniref:Uncharacterized protein n=1 Tax=Cinchona calisaya TaxID=153742 RepID=A0ABD2YBJ5_9GENT
MVHYLVFSWLFSNQLQLSTILRCHHLLTDRQSLPDEGMFHDESPVADDSSMFSDANLIEIFNRMSRELGRTLEQSSFYVKFSTPQLSQENAICHALVQTSPVNIEQSILFESPNFCYYGGEVSVVTLAMLYNLWRLHSGQDETCADFQKNDFGDGAPSGIQLYFFDTEEELSRRFDASPKLRESTVKLLMNVLATSQVAAIWTESGDQNLYHSLIFRFEVDLKDDNGTITASVFAELGEKHPGYTTVEAMQYFKQQRVLIQQNLSIAEQESSSSRVRVRLENKFDAAEGAHEETEEYESDADESEISKKTKLISS